MSFKKILLAVDNSKYSKKGLELTAKLAGGNNTPVVLVHVLNPVSQRIPKAQRDALIKEMQEETRSTFAEYRTRLEDAGLQVTGLIPEGEAADEILLAAKEEGCDLIVIGAKGHGNIGGLVLGAISHRILFRAEVPVLVAR